MFTHGDIGRLIAYLGEASPGFNHARFRTGNLSIPDETLYPLAMSENLAVFSIAVACCQDLCPQQLSRRTRRKPPAGGTRN